MAKRLSDAQDNESKLEIARQAGFEFDLEEAKKAKEELSDEDLDSVAGGDGDAISCIVFKDCGDWWLG